MPSSARRIMFPFFGAFRRIRTIVPRADEGIGPYIGHVIGPANSQFVSLPWKAGTRKKRLPMLLGSMGNREEGR